MPAITTERRARATTARDAPNAAEVWEIWCKNTKTVIWWCAAYTEGLLKEVPDPLKLTGFYPCPRPLYGTMTTDSLIPVPDYTLYQDQAKQIDRLTRRISVLSKAVQIGRAHV